MKISYFLFWLLGNPSNSQKFGMNLNNVELYIDKYINMFKISIIPAIAKLFLFSQKEVYQLNNYSR